MSVTKSKLQLWDSKCAYQLCYLYVHDKSANAGTTLFGGFDVDHSKTPHLNQGVSNLTGECIRSPHIVWLSLMERIGLVATCLSQ